jgi:hypothetical protein
MRQTISLIIFISWFACFVLLCNDEPGWALYEGSDWIGWAFVLYLLGAPFVAVNIGNPPTKK